MTIQDIRSEIVAYIRNNGVLLADYDISKCVAYLYDVYHCEDVDAYRNAFDYAMFAYRIRK